MSDGGGAATGPGGGGAAGQPAAQRQPPISLSGTLAIHADRERAWAVLTDPVALAACLPVPATAEAIPPDAFVVSATVTAMFFPIRVVVEGRFTERVAPERAVLAATAAVPGGGVAAEARLELVADDASSTTLRWELEATPSGLAATLAGHGLPPAVPEAIARTLRCLAARIEA